MLLAYLRVVKHNRRNIIINSPIQWQQATCDKITCIEPGHHDHQLILYNRCQYHGSILCLPLWCGLYIQCIK